MGLGRFFKGLMGGGGHDLAELSRRLGLSLSEIQAVPLTYREFDIPKRGGGTRHIVAPDDQLKALQRRVLRRVLGRLRAHPNATGFERRHSIVTNAALHVGRAVVVRIDLRDFFTSTSARRVESFFRRIGWAREPAALLTTICTYRGTLPQGAPTSPRLSNLVNYRLDARLAALAARFEAAYTRYADDLTFSFAEDRPGDIRQLINTVRMIVRDEGYEVHPRKTHIRRRHQQQVVTGLVVNERVNLPRALRRRLRAAEHYQRVGRPATWSEEQLAGWRALRSMIDNQRS